MRRAALPTVPLLLVASLLAPLWSTAGATAAATTTTAHPSTPAHLTAAAVPNLPAPAGSQSAQLQPALASGKVPAYWLVASDGGIFSFGGAGFYGSTGGMKLNRPIVGMAGTHDSGGYWLVASDGGIFTFGDAAFYGSTGALTLNKPVVGMAPTADGRGYWLVASDGGIFSFGDAAFYGSTGNLTLNKPIVAMAATPDGHGYWLVASDGGIFAYGDARFYGSTGSLTLQKPVVALAASPNGTGYLLVASDGGVFSFGKTAFWGSLGSEPLARPIVSMATNGLGTGYWFTDNNGAVSAFGSAGYYGSAPQVLVKPVVGMAEAAGTGIATAGPYPSGSYGYDVSNYQCNATLPTGHTIGIVQVEGASQGSTNPCLVNEAKWAGAGLNLYVYLTYGTASSGPGVCNNDPACNFGFATGQNAYARAKAAGVNTQVTWWLDVEPDPSWSTTNLSENAQMVAGAIAGLRAEGINNVGIYASPDAWNGIVGPYQPAVPYWMADWTGSGPTACALVSTKKAKFELPTGPVELVQYQSNTFDDDYAC